MQFLGPNPTPLDIRFLGKNNRREIFRIGVSRPVVLTDDTGTAVAGETLDISAKGFGATFEHPFSEPESDSVCNFVVCVDFLRTVEGVARVARWYRHDDDAEKGYDIGFEILSMDAESQKKLTEFLSECQTLLAKRAAKERRNKGKPAAEAPEPMGAGTLEARLEKFYDVLDSKLVPYCGEKGA